MYLFVPQSHLNGSRDFQDILHEYSNSIALNYGQS